MWPASRLADSSNSVVELRADNSFAQMIVRGGGSETEKQRGGRGGGVVEKARGARLDSPDWQLPGVF